MPLISTRSCLHALVTCGALAGATLAAQSTKSPAVASSGKARSAPPAAAAPHADPLAEARQHLTAGRIDEATKLLQALLAEHAGDEPAVRVALSEAQLKAHQPERAVETLDPLVDSRDPDVLLALGRAYKALGDHFQQQGRSGDDVGFAYDEARSYLDLAAQRAPAREHAAALELGLLELYVLGDHQSALSRADAVLKADDENGEALLLRGCAGVYAVVAAQNEGEQDDEAAACKRAIADLLAADKALPKERYEPWVQLTWLYEVSGRQLDAVQAAVTVLERYPAADFSSLYHLAVRYSAERQWDAAALALTEMARRDQAQLTEWVAADAEPAAMVGQLAGGVGPLVEQHMAEARDILKALLAVQPACTDANIWNNYGLFCRDTSQFEESYRAYSEALKLTPDDPALNNDTAVILHYYLHRDTAKAQEMYERALELAEQALEDRDLPKDRRQELETVRRDAKTNLAKLARGDNQWRG